ncbi:MAG: MOSC domain-containing protein [Chloroflexota bacterium]
MSEKLLKYVTQAELEGLVEWVSQSPREVGRLEMIVARPGKGLRQVLTTGELDPEQGLVGDNWRQRNSQADSETQIALMNARVAQAIARGRERWPLAGDQLYLDLDLSVTNLRPGQRLLIGTAELEITPVPHTGCSHFTDHFGHSAIRWVNSARGRELRLRGVYARVVRPGLIHTGDTVQVLPGAVKDRL